MQEKRIKNILHLIETSEPGGSETILAYIAANLDQAEYKSLVCLLSDGWLTKRLDDLGIEYIILENKRPYDPVFLYNLIKLIKRRQIHLIHAHEFMMNIYGSVAGKLCGIPMIGTVHGKLYFTDKKSRIYSYKLAVALCTRMILVSEDLKSFFIENLKLRNNKKLLTLYNGIDINKYGSKDFQSDLRRELGIDPNAVLGCTIGSLFKVKGLPYLLDAIAIMKNNHPQFRFIIAGEGGELEQLQAQCRELKLDDVVSFLGFRDDVPNLLAISDFYVCSSLSEGLSLAILEAIAAGKPVIATNVGGNPEIIEDNVNGFLVPSRDSKALADKISILVMNSELRTKMGMKALQTAINKFSLKSMIDGYQKLYQEFLGKQK